VFERSVIPVFLGCTMFMVLEVFKDNKNVRVIFLVLLLVQVLEHIETVLELKSTCTCTAGACTCTGRQSTCYNTAVFRDISVHKITKIWLSILQHFTNLQIFVSRKSWLLHVHNFRIYKLQTYQLSADKPARCAAS